MESRDAYAAELRETVSRLGAETAARLDAEARLAAASDLRQWCGAPADLGGQQPCPMHIECIPGTCAIAATSR